MANFTITPLINGTTPVPTRVWKDPPFLQGTARQPSRIAPNNDRQHRFYRVSPGTLVQLQAIMLDATAPELDAVVGAFTCWAVERPTETAPTKTYPVPGTSAVVNWLLEAQGHYTFAMRHENTQDAPKASAGGAVVIHIDATGD